MAPSKRWLGIVGVLATVAPRLVLSLHAKVNLLGFRNTEAIEPSPWLVRITRVFGILAILFAVVGPDTALDAVSEDDTGDEIDFV